MYILLIKNFQFILNICPEHISFSRFQSGGQLLCRPVSHGNQSYQSHPDLYPLSKPLPKYEGFIQSAGEAQYMNDIPPMPNEVFGAFVLSTTHSGEVDKIYIDDALVRRKVHVFNIAMKFVEKRLAAHLTESCYSCLYRLS